ncbi:MAG TPA: response regulator transcription factor, partial [Bacteroidia bacterium]|nr:response regulator transcription factor [Bacteroidia bacterium]
KEIEIVGEALNGEELIRQVEIHRPDVVLTDVQMPVKDGIEAAREIHATYPEIKIIALTMLNESMFIRRMLEAGVSGYVIKTVDKDELIRVIHKVAAGEKHFGEEVTAELMNNFSGKTSETNPADVLTRREKEILTLIAQGLTDKEIAEKVFLSSLTIITHRKNILSKLGLKNKVEITRFAMENGLLA